MSTKGHNKRADLTRFAPNVFYKFAPPLSFLNIFKTLVAYEVQQESASNFLLSSRQKSTDNNNKLNNVHSRKRRGNSGFFEETRDDDLERECHEERCSQEELAEIFPGKHNKQVAEWERLTQLCY